MRLTLKDKAGRLYTLNSADHRVSHRGLRGWKAFTPQGPLVLIPRLLIQLLPGQSMAVTCPDCQEARVFNTAGPHYVNQHCMKCVEAR